jgi:hypothetical protein
MGVEKVCGNKVFEVAEFGVTQDAAAHGGEVRQILEHRHRVARVDPVGDDVTPKGLQDRRLHCEHAMSFGQARGRRAR